MRWPAIDDSPCGHGLGPENLRLSSRQAVGSRIILKHRYIQVHRFSLMKNIDPSVLSLLHALTWPTSSAHLCKTLVRELQSINKQIKSMRFIRTIIASGL